MDFCDQDINPLGLLVVLQEVWQAKFIFSINMK